MIYFVTPLLRIDEEDGKSTVEEARELMLKGFEASVPDDETAKAVLLSFDLSPEDAEDRILFARTGITFVPS